MIVVVGSPTGLGHLGGVSAAGLALSIARAAADSGAPGQLIGKVGEGSVGDAVLLDVAEAGIGHVAVLRDIEKVAIEPELTDQTEAPIDELAGLAGADDAPPKGRDRLFGPALDAGDLELALRYLPDSDVVVVAQPLDPAAVAAVVEGARWAGARLVSTFALDGLPDDATVFEAPDENPEGAFASVVGRYAAALDRGVDPGAAFEEAAAGLGWSPVATD